MKQASWLIVDWGTTNFRAFAIDELGNVVAKIEKPMGLLQVKDGEFASALESVLTVWLSHYQTLPIFMAGMVGSAQGWVPVPYEYVPVDLNDIASKSIQFTLPWGAQATIVPGLCEALSNGSFDVMRGEEVQLLGLQSLVTEPDFTAVLPGTHSKHVNVKKRKIESFKTYMTGEFFSILSKHSIIGMALPNQECSQASFIKGVSSDLGPELMNTVFSARTLRLFDKIKETEVLEYLSGLLIGNELSSLGSEKIYIVGNVLLSDRYQSACHALNLKCEVVDGELAFLEGMKKIKEHF